MAKVTLNISSDNAEGLYQALVRQKTTLLEELDSINENIDALRDIIVGSTKQETIVLSESDPGKSYMVTKEYSTLRCTCPSWEFDTGTDLQGYCKHIRKVLREGRFI